MVQESENPTPARSSVKKPRAKRAPKEPQPVTPENEIVDVEEALRAVMDMNEEPPKKTRKPRKPRAVAEPVVTEAQMEEAVEKVLKRRRKMTYDELAENFDELLCVLYENLAQSKELNSKDFNRLIKTSLKHLKKLKTNSLRSFRVKRASNGNKNSGLEKPQQISEDMATFGGWNPADPKSRVDVTRLLCKYIADNNLQNPAYKKEIVPDEHLKKLLNYDPDQDEKLTYCTLQRKIQPHFVK